jgi:hypothetical protein
MKYLSAFLLGSGCLSGFLVYLSTGYSDPSLIPGLMVSTLVVLTGIGTAILAIKE